MARKSVRSKHYKRRAAQQTQGQSGVIGSKDFIVYLAAAMVLRRVQWFNKEDATVFITAIQAAYAAVAEATSHKSLRFQVTADPIHGTSGEVDEMITYLLTNWARRGEDRHTIYLENISEEIALRYLTDPRAQSKEMWLVAADAFLTRLEDVRRVGYQPYRSVSHVARH